MSAMSAGGHALHAVLYATLYFGGRGGRSLFAGGSRAMRYVLEAEKDVQHVL